MNEDMSQQTPHKPPKTLRFVTNYGPPPSKRRRVAAACYTCRKRKTACSGERPSCDTCKQNRLECGGFSSETGATAGHKRTASDTSAKKPVSNGSDTDERPKGRQRQIKQEQQDLDFDLHNNYMNDEDCHPSSLPLPKVHSGPLSPKNGMNNVTHLQASGPEQNEERRRRESLFSGSRNRMPYFRW